MTMMTRSRTISYLYSYLEEEKVVFLSGQLFNIFYCPSIAGVCFYFFSSLAR